MNKQFKHYLTHTIAEGSEGGSGEDSTKPKDTDTSSARDNSGEDSGSESTSKEFSRALAKRIAEIEAKYADYDQLKAKAAKFDEAQNESKSELDKLSERLAAIEQERNELQAKQAHTELVNTVAKETNVPVELVAMLSGDEKSLKANAEKLAKSLTTSTLPPTGKRGKTSEDEDMTAHARLSAAYNNK